MKDGGSLQPDCDCKLFINFTLQVESLRKIKCEGSCKHMASEKLNE